MVDYDFYAKTYLGDAIPENAFSGVAKQASDILDKFGRIYRVESSGPDAEKMAVCAMAETLYHRRKSRGGVIAASAGNVAVRYSDRKQGKRSLMAELFQEASVYLDIYRGGSV